MSIQLITDSSSDLTKEMIQEYNVEVARLSVTFGDVEYVDGVDITKEEFYQKLVTSPVMPFTSQVTPYQFEELYRKALDEGKKVLVITLSSDLSGTYQSACIAKESIENNGDIHIIDSRTVSFGLALLVKEAAELISFGLDIVKIEEQIQRKINRCVFRGVVDTLTYLQKGGRLSTSAATLGSLLNIKPVLGVHDGKVEVVYKTRGQKKAMQKLYEELEAKQMNFSDKTVILAHSNASEILKQFREGLEERFKIGQIITVSIGPIVGAHAGPGCFGFAYIE